MSKIGSLVKFVGYYLVWGATIGTLLGLAYTFCLFFGFYSIFGIVFNTFAGIFLGMLNGVVLGYIRFFLPIGDEKSHRQRLRRTAFCITGLAGFLVYVLMLYPLTRNPSVAALFALPPTFLAMAISTYASGRLDVWQRIDF